MWEGGSLSLARSIIVVIGQADLVLSISSVLINPSLSSSSARITRAISTLLHTDPSPSTSAFTSDTDSNTIRICSSLPISYDCGKLILPRWINNFCGALSSPGTRIHEANSSFFVIRRQKLVSPYIDASDTYTCTAWVERTETVIAASSETGLEIGCDEHMPF
ncbi:hypothetical protein GYMLUDRAFT_48843 [Collybiopsis luxurians FD-317 M1]|uniref:Uncharacterized protein n=1 Tax=Collybiopsis luxurians FD-317 M1 TaxID=944289 RepID=A0A0D0AUQ8_9AGAR|nr:hypothetical protein GYMLUDRAFT_48843 [Collybiopsis luxurians FD-317 M1]